MFHFITLISQHHSETSPVKGVNHDQQKTPDTERSDSSSHGFTPVAATRKAHTLPTPDGNTNVASLDECNVEQVISRYGTMPKGARIGAYLASLEDGGNNKCSLDDQGSSHEHLDSGVSSGKEQRSLDNSIEEVDDDPPFPDPPSDQVLMHTSMIDESSLNNDHNIKPSAILRSTSSHAVSTAPVSNNTPAPASNNAFLQKHRLKSSETKPALPPEQPAVKDWKQGLRKTTQSPVPQPKPREIPKPSPRVQHKVLPDKSDGDSGIQDASAAISAGESPMIRKKPEVPKSIIASPKTSWVDRFKIKKDANKPTNSVIKKPPKGSKESPEEPSWVKPKGSPVVSPARHQMASTPTDKEPNDKDISTASPQMSNKLKMSGGKLVLPAGLLAAHKLPTPDSKPQIKPRGRAKTDDTTSDPSTPGCEKVVTKGALLKRCEHLDKTVSSLTNAASRQSTMYIQLADEVQGFYNDCLAYVESKEIPPHSKFQFRELLSRLLRQGDQLKTISGSKSYCKLVSDVHTTVKDIKQILER